MEKIVARGKSGCELSRLEIVKRCRPLVLSSIRKYHSYGSYDDLFQEGVVVILEAIDSYDESYGVYFLGYLKSKLKYYYLGKKDSDELSLNNRNEHGIEYLEVLESDFDLEELILKNIESVFLKQSLRRLSRREALIVYKFYFEDMKLGEIAKELGLSYQTVANLKYRGLKKLKNMVKK